MLLLRHIPFALSAVLCVASTATASFGQDVIAAANSPAQPTTPTASTDTSTPPKNASSQFILGSADVIHINVWKNTDLSQTVTVGPDGFVSLPLIGDVHVAGMTANELGRSLAARLNTYMVNPQVTVSVVDIRSRQVYVLGQVGKPGGYPLIAPVTVLQLIAEAGGLSNYANRKGIFILRAGDNSSTKISFNYNNVIHGDGKQNITLQPGDTVVVP